MITQIKNSLISVVVGLVAVTSSHVSAQSLSPSLVDVAARGACSKFLTSYSSSPDEVIFVQNRALARTSVCQFDLKSRSGNTVAFSFRSSKPQREFRELQGAGPHLVRFRFRAQAASRRTRMVVVVKATEQESVAPISQIKIVNEAITLPSVTSSCYAPIKALRDEELTQRECVVDADCGNNVLPFGCGCQFAKPVKVGGDSKKFVELLKGARALGCETQEVSVCGCAEITGVACRKGMCDWKVG